MAKKKFATMSWAVEDVKTLRPNWSKEKCEEWLEMNAREITDQLVERGWDVIETLLGQNEGEEG
jgi:hypothetical protein